MQVVSSLEGNNLPQLVKFPTHKAGHTHDLIFSNIRSLKMEVPKLVVWSDHFLIPFYFNLAKPDLPECARYFLKRNWKKLTAEYLVPQQKTRRRGPWINAGREAGGKAKLHRKVSTPWIRVQLIETSIGQGSSTRQTANKSKLTINVHDMIVKYYENEFTKEKKSFHSKWEYTNTN